MYNNQITIENTTICFSLLNRVRFTLVESFCGNANNYRMLLLEFEQLLVYVSTCSYIFTIRNFLRPVDVIFYLTLLLLLNFQSILPTFFQTNLSANQLTFNCKRSNTWNCKPTISYQLNGLNFLLYKVDSRYSILYILNLLHVVL